MKFEEASVKRFRVEEDIITASAIPIVPEITPTATPAPIDDPNCMTTNSSSFCTDSAATVKPCPDQSQNSSYCFHNVHRDQP